MIREVETLTAVAGLRLPRLAVATASSTETLEAEISRLTWTVLDGSASPADRARLAELVRAQHALRPHR